MLFRFIPIRRREGPRALYALVAWAMFTGGYFLFREQCAGALGETRFGDSWWLPPAAFAWLAWLHLRTGGRSSPTAALAFVLFGPVLGVGILIPWAIKEQRQFEAAGVVQRLTIADALAFAHTMGCVALLAACAAALIHAAVTYQEWIAAHIVVGPTRSAMLARQHAPFFLAELGLDRSSSLADLDRAYRERAQRLHPDRGGAPADFKRLQASYERAREYLSKRPAECVDPACADSA